MKKRAHVAIVLAALVGMSACVGTDVGNPGDEEAEVEMHVTGYESGKKQQALNLPGETEVESIWLVVDEFRFQQASACGETERADHSEPLVVDLLADEPTYEPPHLTEPAGEYCRLDVGLAEGGVSRAPKEAPDALSEHGLVIEGQRAGGTDFRIEADLGGEFYLVGLDEHFDLAAESQSLVVGFGVDQWIDEEDLDMVERSDGDTLVIDEKDHPDFIEEIQKRATRSAGLFEDGDGDGRLDADERRNAVAEGAEEVSNDHRQDEDAGEDASGGGR